MGSCCCICIFCDHIRQYFAWLRARLASQNLHTMLFHQHGSDRTLRKNCLRPYGSSRPERLFLSCSHTRHRRNSHPGMSLAFCKVLRGARAKVGVGKKQKENSRFTYICGLKKVFSFNEILVQITRISHAVNK